MSPAHLLLALGVVIVWGLNFIAIRWGVDEVPPLMLSALRFLLAALPAVLLIRRPAVPWRLVVLYGLVNGVMQFGLLFSAIGLGMPAGLSSLVMQLQAFFTIGLAMLFLGERPKPIQFAGAAIAFAGIAAIGLERLEGLAFLPFLMTIAAAFFWGCGNIVTKQAGRVDMLAFVVWSSLVPPLPLFLGSLLLERGSLASLGEISLRGMGSIAFLAFGATLFGYGAWTMLLSRYPAGLVAPLTLLVPIVGIGSAALLLGEQVTQLEILGSLLVLLGLLVNVFGPRLLTRFAA